MPRSPGASATDRRRGPTGAGPLAVPRAHRRRARPVDGDLVLGDRDRARAHRPLAARPLGRGLADHRGAGRLRRRRARLEPRQPRRHRPPRPADGRLGGARRRRQPRAPRRARRGRGHRRPHRHRPGAGRRLPAGAEADGDLVPPRPRPGARRPDRGADPRLGAAAPVPRARRARLAAGGVLELGREPRRRGAVPRRDPRGSIPLRARDNGPAPDRRGVPQPAADARQPRLLRPHVGALRDVGLVPRLRFRCAPRQARPGGRRC